MNSCAIPIMRYPGSTIRMHHDVIIKSFVTRGHEIRKESRQTARRDAAWSTPSPQLCRATSGKGARNRT